MYLRGLEKTHFKYAWQLLKFVCSKFRTKLNLPLFKFCSVLAKYHLLVEGVKGGRPLKLKTYCT